MVLRASELDQFALASDPWFPETYSTVAQYDAEDPILILQRTAETQPLIETPTGLTLISSLSINQIATDFSLNPLDTGRLARVRIEWFMEAPVESSKQVTLRIQEGEAGSARENTFMSSKDRQAYKLVPLISKPLKLELPSPDCTSLTWEMLAGSLTSKTLSPMPWQERYTWLPEAARS